MSKRVNLILRDADEAMIAPSLHLNRPGFDADFMFETSPAGMLGVERSRRSRTPRVGRSRAGCADAGWCSRTRRHTDVCNPCSIAPFHWETVRRPAMRLGAQHLTQSPKPPVPSR